MDNRRQLIVSFCLIASLCGSSEGAAKQPDLLISALTELPMLAVVRDRENSSVVHYVGYVKTIFDWLSERMHLTYAFVPIPDDEVKARGTAGAAVHYLNEKKVDIVSSFLIPTPQRLTYMDFTFPLLFSDYGLVQPMPGFQSRLFASIKPFQPWVWFLVLLTLVAMATIFSLYTFYIEKQRQDRVSETVSRNFIYAFTILTGQGENFTSSRNALRIVATGWCLAAIVLVNVYNGILVSYLSVPKFEPVVNSFHELAHSKTLQIALQKGTIVAQHFMEAKSGDYKILGDTLRNNPNHLTSSDREMFQLLYTGCCAFATVRSLMDIYVYLAANEAGKCRLTGSQSVGFFQMFSFGLSKDLKYKERINRELQFLSQTGLPGNWGRMYLKRKVECSERLIDRPKNSRISLSDLSSAFIILAIGCCVSTLTFLSELVLKHKTFAENEAKPVGAELVFASST